VPRLESGDSVLFCTGGVTVSMNADEESSGTDRLVAVSEEHPADSPTHLLQAIIQAAETFSRGRAPHDDMAAAPFYCSE
jgi:serine phosphatase RsbU (regulator of sigma subunit)